MPYWSLHTHTRESANDALPSVRRVVEQAKELGYPALAITDHGTVSGAVEFYNACRKAGIKPLIGVEAYVAMDRLTPTWSPFEDPTAANKRTRTMHMLVVAYTTEGYRNLCRLITASNEAYKYKPVLDMDMLSAAHERGDLRGLLVTTGCWFGLLPILLRDGHMASAANVVKALETWFDGMAFVEVQNHMVMDVGHNDETQARLVHTFATVHGFKTVLGQDSHYIHLEDQSTHDAFKTLTSWDLDNPDSGTFPGDGYHMADADWIADHFPPDIHARGMAGLDLIAEVANLHIPELDHYELKVPDTTVSGDPDTELQQAVAFGLTEFEAKHHFPKSKIKEYKVRANEELSVVTDSGFAGYLMLVKWVCDFMRERDIRYRVRGSASGSLICWVIGITGYDPIKWNLSFDRFLSRDRAKPPDIDLDIEHHRRQEVVDALAERFHVTHIGTTMQYGIKRDDFDEDSDGKGSLMVAWKMRARNIGADPDAPVPQDWMRKLYSIAEYNGVRKDGTFIEPPIKSFGKHPAGLLIAPDAQTLADVPQRLVASSKTMVSAYDMDDVEKLGLVKLDALGLRTLTAVRIAEEVAGVRCEDFPFSDAKAYARISSGNTAGMFQLDGWTASKGARRMRPTKIGDVIAIMALFRPAAMDAGATESYLQRRQGTEKIPTRHEIIMKHTADTYGVLVYQEQALDILKDIGMSVEDIEKARKAIKASNANVGDASKTLNDLMGHIQDNARSVGMTDADLDWLSNALHAYAGYSFNRAHATAYGVLAYQTAYLAVHHPLAFWTGNLVAFEDAPAYRDGTKPVDYYIHCARSVGLKIRGAHVNRSELSFSTDGKAIYKGLTSIQGVGQVAAQELYDKRPFTTLDQMAQVVSPSKVGGIRDLQRGHKPASCSGAIKALDEAGALHDIGWEMHTGPLSKEMRSLLISMTNQQIKEIHGERESRKLLGQLVDELADNGTYEGLSKPEMILQTLYTYDERLPD